MKCNVTVEGFVASSVSFFGSSVVVPSTTGLLGFTHSVSEDFFSSVFSAAVVFSSEASVFSASVVFSSEDSVFSASVVFFSEASVFFSASVTVVASLEASVFFSASVAFSFAASVVASLSDTAATSLANDETGAVLNATVQARVRAKRFL